jgi:hypothetical protein
MSHDRIRSHAQNNILCCQNCKEMAFEASGASAAILHNIKDQSAIVTGTTTAIENPIRIAHKAYIVLARLGSNSKSQI